jgi:predicted ATPase
MIITHVSLENWKNFRKAEVDLGKRMFLIGPNASGKSNFLDAIRFLRDVAERGLRQAVEERGGISQVRCLHARKPRVVIGVTLDDRWKYELSIEGKKGGQPTVAEEKVFQRLQPDGVWESITTRPDANDKKDPARLTQTALEQVNANKKFRDIPDFFKTIAYRHILPQAVRDPKGFSSVQVKNDPYGRDLVFQIHNTPKKIREGRLGKISEALRLAVPELDSLNVNMDTATGVPHLISGYKHWRSQSAKQNEVALSDGTLRLLALLWSLFEQGGTLLLEEPELSLHDEVVRQLPGMFARLWRKTKKIGKQILVSTHSETMLQDSGVGPGEVLILAPGPNGTEIQLPSKMDRDLMRGGLSAAEVLLNKTRPANVKQLSLFDFK